MASYTNPPWFVDTGAERTIIRGSDGNSICSMLRSFGDRNIAEQDANAALMAYAPELFRAVADLVSVMRRSDSQSCGGDEWDAALDDAQVLIDLLAEDGVTLDEAVGAVDVAPIKVAVDCGHCPPFAGCAEKCMKGGA